MGIWQQLRLDMQISLNFGSYARKKHLSRQNSRTVLDLQSKPWIKSPIALVFPLGPFRMALRHALFL